jgi:hypothetical protein
MRSAFFPHFTQKYNTQFHLIDQSNSIAHPSTFIVSLIIIMKFHNHCIDFIVERREPTSSAHAAGGSPVSSFGTVSEKNTNAKYADAHFCSDQIQNVPCLFLSLLTLSTLD